MKAVRLPAFVRGNFFMSYSSKLKNPLWQKLRLKVFERDRWTCLSCGDDTNELQVHHLRYSGKPWESNPDDLMTLCDSCHDSITASVGTIKDAMVLIQRNHGATGIDEAERIMTMLSKQDPTAMMAIRKLVSVRPDYEMLIKLFRHG